MRGQHITPRIGLVALVLMALLASFGLTGRAAGYSPGCGQIPIVYGIPPWGFQAPALRSAKRAASLAVTAKSIWSANTVSGILCQEDRSRNRADTRDHHDR